MKYKQILFWAVVFGGLLAFLQMAFRYHFYYIEQSQMFLFSTDYCFDRLFVPGGFSLWISEFLVQFFVYPYVGPTVVAALLALVGICTAGICKQIAPKGAFPLLYLLPAIALLFMHFDFNYRTQGTVAYLLMELVLYGYMRLRNDRLRLAVGLVSVPILFWIAGSVAGMFALMAGLFEWSRKTPGGYLAWLDMVVMVLLGIGSVYFSFVGEYRWAFLPDLYYHDMLFPPKVMYASWVILPVAVIIAYGLRNRIVRDKRILAACWVVQGAIVFAIFWWGIPKFSGAKTLRLKKMDYFARTEQWDEIIGMCKGEITNYLYMCHLNIALANKGELAEKMFYFDQRGPKGLFLQWNESENISCMLSDLFFTVGAIASSQEMAFEGFVCAMGNGNPRMLKRLVQTNLIYGTYPVAEKYIALLEQTFAYREWATAHRRFLYNDEAVEQDPVLGSRRKLLPEQSRLAMLEGLEGDLEILIQRAPANSAAIQSLGAVYLLSKDLKSFQALVEKYYGTKLLPVLPVSFQEAVIVLSEKEQDYWKRFGISEAVAARFADYKKQVLANRNNRAIARQLNRSYGNTYWFYFMFK